MIRNLKLSRFKRKTFRWRKSGLWRVSRLQRISLFWRTFLFLSLLLLGSIFAWFQTFRALEEAPRAVQSARQLASLVNLTRAALIHADPIARVSLVKTLVDEENVRIAVREPTDLYTLYGTNSLGNSISKAVSDMLGQQTIVASSVNGFNGLWIGFSIDEDTYWLLADPERLGAISRTTWAIWLGIAASLSLLGAVAMARLINRPLKQLALAAAAVREGQFTGSRLDENVPTSEIREVNVEFNRMADKLNKADTDRTLMLAGISHDLRTPLSRLRLEIEMSVNDTTARDLMAADIDQVNAIIDKFLDYARADRVTLESVDLLEVTEAAAQPLVQWGGLDIDIQIPLTLKVMADAVELRRVISNLLENAMRYGKGDNGAAQVDIHAEQNDDRVLLVVRDHGRGVQPASLKRLTEPFYRADEARTAAGAGLGLSIVSKTVSRMGGRLTLNNHPEGGLEVTVDLSLAP